IFGRETPAALDGRRKTQKHVKRSLRWTGEVRRKSMQNARCAGREKSDAQNRLPSPVSHSASHASFIYFLYFIISSLAIRPRCTSSGPSARRRARAAVNRPVSGKSSDKPPPPC